MPPAAPFSEVANPEGLSEADLAVAIVPRRGTVADPSLPTMKAALGLERLYPELKSAIIYCDSPDRAAAKAAFFAAEARSPRLYAATAGSRIGGALALASRLKVRALALVDADLLSVKTTWIKSLFEPILSQGAEYVAPLYVRHKHEALLSRWLAYPLFRALFGRRIMQPIEADRAFSGRLLEIYNAEVFEDDGYGYRADLKFLSLAVIRQARICQSFMGHPRVLAGAGETLDMFAACADLARAFFELMAGTREHWPGIGRSRPTALAGADEEIKNPPPQIEVDPADWAERFLELGLKRQAVWESRLSPPTAGELGRELARAAGGQPPRTSLDLWRAGLYEASAVYQNESKENREALVAALVPVFLARCLTGLTESWDFNARQLNAQAEEAALNFEKTKGELTALWRAASLIP